MEGKNHFLFYICCGDKPVRRDFSTYNRYKDSIAYNSLYGNMCDTLTAFFAVYG